MRGCRCGLDEKLLYENVVEKELYEKGCMKKDQKDCIERGCRKGFAGKCGRKWL